jgi:rhodanese-related sulfurtransferase
MILTAILLATLQQEPAVVQHLQPAAVKALVDKGDAIVIDVRGSVPYELGHVTGAVWMPLGLLAQRAGELPQDKTIVTYCTCKAEETSLEAAKVLASMGFPRVAVLVGGYPAWKEAGLPVESNRAPAPVAAGADGGRAGGRLAPPAAVACSRDDLTAYAGEVVSWIRDGGRTTVTMKTSAGTTETVAAGTAAGEPARFFLFESSAFLEPHWARIEAEKGKVRSGVAAVAWVCADGRTWIDWRPGAKFQGAE